jgi:hypothetical protein
MNARTVKFSMAVLVFAWAIAARPLFATSVAAPDTTPLLFDRIQAFENVVIVHLEDGFETQAIPQPNSNCVFLSADVDKTLKGAFKPGAKVTINCHQELPTRLAARDAGKKRRYLLVLNSAKEGYAFLGGHMLDTDLDRFLLCDDSLEAVANSFMAAQDDTPDTLLADCLQLLAKTDLTEAGFRHVHELLDRIVPLCGEDGKAKAAEQLQTLLKKADRPGAEAIYNTVVDVLTIIGVGEGLTRKTVETRREK